MAKQNKEYVYVDCYQCDENGKSSPWKRKHLDDVPKWQHEEAKDFNCFATVQKYANEKKTEGEDFLAPLYFDLDYSENPAVAQEEAIKLVEFFTGELDIQEQDLHIYFSGSKGFHILVDERALGVEPRKDLQRVYKHIAGYLRYRLGEVQEQEDENGRPVEYTEPLKAVDLVVYTVKRMLRLPYSRHQKTGLYKIELTLQQLKELTLDEIKERARTGQPIQREEKTVRKRPKAGIFYADKLHEYEEAAATVSDKRNKTEYVFVKDKPPICVEDILNNGWKKDGDRNNATVQLCCYFKAAGYKKEEATSILEDWVVKFTSADSRYSIQQRNLATGSEFILQPPIAGVTSITDTGTVVMAAERESLDAAWTRILDKAENPDTGGNVHDYERWVVDGFYKDYGVKVGKVLVDMCWNKDNGHDGRGTVRVVVVDDTYGPLDTSIVNDIKEYLDPKAYEGYGYGKAPGGAVVTVITGTPYDINISAHVEYEKNVDRAEVLQQFTELVTEYVKSRVFNRNDDTKELSPIAYKKIAAILGTLSGVANYDDLTVNGGTADITIEPYEIPTVKKVSLT